MQGENDGQLITREYALFCLGRFTAQAIGEHTSYHKNNLSYGTACESAKSNALMRCCKDLGVGSELWDPQVRSASHAVLLVSHNVSTTNILVWSVVFLSDTTSYIIIVMFLVYITSLHACT